MNEENQQEIIARLGMIEQHMQGLQEQLSSVDKGVMELNQLKFGLDELKGSEGKEIVASIGKGIFVKTKLLSEDLIVDIGNKKLVKKNIEDTQKLIEKQVVNLEEAKKEINNNLDLVSKEAEKLIKDFKG